MAENLNIKKCWFHKNHYDIPKKRLDEIKEKCYFVSSKEILIIMDESINYKYCPRCDSKKHVDEFYDRRGKKGGSVYCKMCTKNEAIERQNKLKKLAVTYKGGKCELCGYDKYIGALEFHHKNPEEKDFGIGNLKSYKLTDIIKLELDKCMLLCANCHRETHNKIKNETLP